MTDRMAALRSITDQDTPLRVQLLADYERNWQHHPLAMNKWFRVQAQSWLPDTLAQVQRLSQHPKFSWQNPNNVYTLIGGFSANEFRFHQADGQGYDWLKTAVLKMDPANPQVAARLMSAFSDWRKYDEERQGLMKTQIQTILQQPKLSKDVLELSEAYLKEGT